MIGKTTIGRSFKGCINYNLSKVENGEGEILEVRGVREDRKAMIRDFNMRRLANSTITKTVWHTSLSFQDKLTNDQILSIAKDWMKGMGLDATQYIVVRHNDTAHPHVHIVANRIGDTTKTISDSNNWKRSEALCKELIKTYGLTPVPEHRNEAAISRDKLRGRDLLKTDLNRFIGELIPICQSLIDFQNKLSSHGINSLIKYNPDNSIRGIVFTRDGITIKASDVNRRYSAKGIFALIEENKPQQNKLQARIPEFETASSNRSIKIGKVLFENEDDEETKKKRKNDQSMSI